MKFLMRVVVLVGWAVGCGGGWISVFFLLWTVLLILFYNGMGKFVGAVGIITLGLIRFFHAAVAQIGRAHV